jgi:hypothetical protein
VGFILRESRSQRDGVSLRDGDVFKLVDYHKKPFGFVSEELVTFSAILIRIKKYIRGDWNYLNLLGALAERSLFYRLVKIRNAFPCMRSMSVPITPCPEMIDIGGLELYHI